MIAWRAAKARHPPFDGTGAFLSGARWNSSGRSVIYAADGCAGSILEILAHTLRPRTLPGPHHAVRIEIAETVGVELLGPDDLAGWEARDSAAARAFGDRWHDERWTAVLIVPAVSSRPVGRNVLINPTHPDATAILASAPFDVIWDERLF